MSMSMSERESREGSEYCFFVLTCLFFACSLSGTCPSPVFSATCFTDPCQSIDTNCHLSDSEADCRKKIENSLDLS